MRCFHCMQSITNEILCPYCRKPTTEHNQPHQLAAGTILHQRYLIGNPIGEGGFGITYAGFDQKKNIKIAVKEYFPSGCVNRNHNLSNTVVPGISSKGKFFQLGKERFIQEAKSIARFSGERGIVNIFDFFHENETAYIIMEYLEGNTLSQTISEHGFTQVIPLIKMMMPLMQTLESVHKEGIIHRDISPDNIIMDENGSLTLIDFGSARYYLGEETKSLSVILKSGYTPYEQYSRKGDQGSWTDVYALCATIYKCITGVTPPDALDRAMGETIKKPSETGAQIPPSIEAVLMKGLALYAKNRIQNMKILRESFMSAQKKESQPKKAPLIRVLSVLSVLLFLVLLVSIIYFLSVNSKHNSSKIAILPTTQPTTVTTNKQTPQTTVEPTEKASTEPSSSANTILSTTGSTTETTTNQTSQTSFEPTEKASTVPTDVYPEDVVGIFYDYAEEILKDQGLSVQIEWKTSPDYDYGFVISMSPDSSSTVKKGSTITLVVCSGREERSNNERSNNESDSNE